MATRKGINISGNYAAPQNCFYYKYILYVLCIKKKERSDKIFFLKLNDHPTHTVF